MAETWSQRMFDIGPEKLLLILGIAMVILGPRKLPEMARSLGRGLREFRRASSGIRDELSDEERSQPGEARPAIVDEADPRLGSETTSHDSKAAS